MSITVSASGKSVSLYGMCADISRTWLCGDELPTNEQRHLYAVAQEHIARNIELLKPGVSYSEITEQSHRLPEEFRDQRYGVMMHGVGPCDEYPNIAYPEDFEPGAFDYILEPGMTLCVEAYVGTVGGREGVKLEDQDLITETGVENLTRRQKCTQNFALSSDRFQGSRPLGSRLIDIQPN